MNKSTFILAQRRTNERVTKCVASSLSEAINALAQMKQLRPDQLLEIYKVYEQPSNGR